MSFHGFGAEDIDNSSYFAPVSASPSPTPQVHCDQSKETNVINCEDIVTQEVDENWGGDDLDIVDENELSIKTAPEEGEVDSKGGILDTKGGIVSLNTSHKKTHKTTCKVCNQTFINREERDHHEQITGHYLKFPCSICGRRFRQKIQMARHEAQIHSQEMPYKCNRCDKKFKSEFSWKRHQENDAVHERLGKLLN